jgi:K+-transporting ATPase KdpF subunit
MDTLVWIAGVFAGLLFVYLLVALLLPEKLQ